MKFLTPAPQCELCAADRAPDDDRFCDQHRVEYRHVCGLIVRGGLAILMEQVEAIRAAKATADKAAA